ncbi:thiamine pyrophosphate-binding protein [Pseudonocardia sp.]|uniref:thiamine pyrophosphate-binding protein n=1 Tax=Pseudonocardia sp. TaxID=60912 RepID=UPI003D143232
MPPRSVARLVAERLVTQGVTRLYGLCGGHVQPLWDEVARAGIRIVDVRHEGAAVHMAQAESELTGGLGVALVTAGPGLTNAVTAIANAYVSRSSVLVVTGRPPRPQAGMGAMQDLPQGEIVRPVCRCVEQVAERHHVLPRMDRVIAAALGTGGGGTGPAYLDLPTDLLDEPVDPADAPPAAMRARLGPSTAPVPEAVAAATELIRASRRVVVIGGRPVRSAGAELRSFLDGCGAFFLDTGECRGVIRDDHAAYVPAMRARLMAEADLVITLGRRLDFQLAYGSAAVFSEAVSFLRVGTCVEETAENRRGDVEVVGSVTEVMRALTSAAPVDPDTEWAAEVRAANLRRTMRLAERLADEQLGSDARMHPYRLIGALNERLTDGSVVIADGGDILSFARVGLRTVDYLDCGALGCLGVGVPFAIAASLLRPHSPVIATVGDGSFGFSAMEIDTAVRHRANALFVVANNEAWNIERRDQIDRYAHNLVGVDLPGCRYAELARALGAHGERVENPADLDTALDRALDNTPAVLEVMVTRDATSPDYANGLAHVPAWHALASWNEAELALRASR